MTKKYKNLINPTSQDSEDWKNTLSKAWEIRNLTPPSKIVSET